MFRSSGIGAAALAPGSSAAGAPSEPVSVAGELLKLPWRGDLHRLIEPRGGDVEFFEPQSRHRAGQVGLADMQRQAG